ncbi:hypothetical protein C8R43DRAFT_1007675 [Mycena crocata]|nr:hypothetical protein C8R43DRAFT_1007675 [Mycena crocata]
MSLASSSRTSLTRTQTKTSNGSTPSRRPRPRSPPSMYVAFDTPTAKPPKPLIKLDKKPKTKSSKAKAEPLPPNPFPATHLLPAPVVAEPPQRRPSVGSFLSLRKKSVSSVAPPPPPMHVPPITTHFAEPSYLTPPSRPSHLHETNVHPFEDVGIPKPRRSDKASRLLGKGLSPQRQTFPERAAIEAGYSGTFRMPPRSSSPSNSSLGEGTLSVDDDSESLDDECFTDDSHFQRQSTLLSPMEFGASSRPPSVAVFLPASHDRSDTASEVEWASDSEPITPVAPLPHHDMWSPPPHTHGRPESYASVHDHYSHAHTRTPPEQTQHVDFRPDTPFMDAIVAVNSQVIVPRSGHGHTREPSVTRTETKEGWMGEWNQDDMQDVIHKLRTLK